MFGYGQWKIGIHLKKSLCQVYPEAGIFHLNNVYYGDFIPRLKAFL